MLFFLILDIFENICVSHKFRNGQIRYAIINPIIIGDMILNNLWIVLITKGKLAIINIHTNMKAIIAQAYAVAAEYFLFR